MVKRLAFLCLIASAVVGLAVVIERWGGLTVALLRIGASDWFMIRPDGPRLGARPVRDDIELVLFDVRTAATLGYVRSYDDDVRLYRTLFDQGARAVYDTRVVAAADADAFAEVKPLLESMLEIRDNGDLMRDVWLSAGLDLESAGRYSSLAAQNLVNAQPHAIPSLRPRLYPMFHLTVVGPRESAPLRVARRIWNVDLSDSDQVAEGMRSSGVMSAWHRQAPEVVPETEIAKTSYWIGEREIVWHEFPTTTILVSPAAFWVSYDPAISQYPRHSMLDVLQDANSAAFADKVVIVGYSPETDISSDTYEIPSVVGKAAPAEVFAAALQTLLDDRMMRPLSQPVQWTLLAVLCLAMALIGGLLRPGLAAAAVVGLVVVYFVAATTAYRSGWSPDFALTPLLGILSGVLGGAHSAWTGARARQRVVDLFGRYVPRAVVNQLMLQPELKALTLGGSRRDVSVLFADIRGFTSFAEDLPPEDVVRHLNSLLEIMVECTFDHDGTLDKFIGDAILVLFNAPLEQPDHPRRAVSTAVAMQRRLAGHPSGLRVGIGLHRGDAVVGNIGTERRLEYTAIGSTVNIASRLCGVAAPGEIILSAAMLDGLGDQFATESLGPIQVKNVKQPLDAYRLATENG